MKEGRARLENDVATKWLAHVGHGDGRRKKKQEQLCLPFKFDVLST